MLIYALRHTLAILILPFMVTLVVPLFLLDQWPATPWGSLFISFGLMADGLGLLLMVWTISLFWRKGEGTLAPWDPPKHLIVRGPYRHVRNPMITGVCLVLLGEVLVTGSFALLAWLAVFALTNMIYMPKVEEPQLRARFGEAYDYYCQNVPRWVPRLSEWEQPQGPAT